MRVKIKKEQMSDGSEVMQLIFRNKNDDIYESIMRIKSDCFAEVLERVINSALEAFENLPKAKD